MKSLRLIGLGSIALISSVAFSNVTPMFASLQQTRPAIAQTVKQEAPIQLQLTAEKKSLLAVASGTLEWKALTSNTSLRPGETVRYVVTASNISDRNIKKLVVTQPIPQNSVYVLGSATLPNIQGVKVDYSIDGGKSYTATPTIRVKNEKGEIVTVPAPDSMYTHVRWNFGDNFPAKTAVNATYQVRIR